MGERGFRAGLTAYGDAGFSLFHRKVFLKAMGYSEAALDRPVIGIADTRSDYNSCHANVPQVVEAVKRGVAMAGGVGFAFPVMSLHEAFAHPTSMFLRNLMAMEAEEQIRALPMDAAVLIGGCDKTVPALLMGAISADKPAILEVTGPMLTGASRGERVGACTDCRRFWAAFRAGEMDEGRLAEVNDELGPTIGTCMVMGTASTMALCAEAMGAMLPGGACIPAVHAERLRHAEATGARAVEIARAGGPTLRQLLTRDALDNALKTLLAAGGSTNAVVHLAAIARRLGLPFDLRELDRLGRDLPMIVDLKPSGRLYMQELHEAGGFAAIRRALGERLALDAPTLAGATHRELAARDGGFAQSVVRPAETPIYPSGSIVPLFGGLAPGGAVLKAGAASPHLLRHEGRAVIFDGLDDLAARIDRDDLDVEPEDVLVLRGIGPRGAGMPEAGSCPIPKKLARRGVKDMVRVSDGRMSGTAYGTVILHVSPEAAEAGPLAKLRPGDRVRLDVEARRLDVVAADGGALEDREPAFTRAGPPPRRGYAALFDREILQAEAGCDFRFLGPEGA
jgi:dihydroxy-acid dehydratase